MRSGLGGEALAGDLDGMPGPERRLLADEAEPAPAKAASTASAWCPTTTVTGLAPAAATARSTCSSMGAPRAGWSTLARALFMRVPLPAARIRAWTAVGLTFRV